MQRVPQDWDSDGTAGGKLLKKVLDIYPMRSYLDLGHGYSNDADDTYRGVPHMGYCKRSAPN